MAGVVGDGLPRALHLPRLRPGVQRLLADLDLALLGNLPLNPDPDARSTHGLRRRVLAVPPGTHTETYTWRAHVGSALDPRRTARAAPACRCDAHGNRALQRPRD